MTNESRPSPLRRWAPLLVLAGLIAYLWFFCAPKRLPMSDEGVMVVLAREPLLGHRLYDDIECPYMPLSFILHAGWMTISGSSLLLGRIATLLLAAGTWLVSYRGLTAATNRASAVLGATAAVIATFPYQFYSSYNNYALFFAVASASAVLTAASSERNARAAALAGFCGAAAYFSKQNIGVLAIAGGFAALLFVGVSRKSSRDTIRFTAGAALGGAVLLVACLPFVRFSGMLDQAVLGALRQGAHHATAYPTDQFAQIGRLIASPSLAALDEATHSVSFILPFIIATALAAMTTLLFHRGDRRSAPSMSLAILSAAHGLGAAHAPTTWHLVFSKPVPVIAATYLLYLVASRSAGRIAVFVVIGAFFSIHLGRQIMILDDYDSSIAASEAEGIGLRPWEAEVIDAGCRLMASAPAGEPVFVAAPDPMYYYFLDRHPPVPWIYLDPPSLSEPDRALIHSTLAANKIRYILYPSGRNAFFDYGSVIKGYGRIAEIDSESVGSITVELRRLELGANLEGADGVGASPGSGEAPHDGAGIREGGKGPAPR